MMNFKSLALAGTIALVAAVPAAAQVNGQMKISYCRGQVAASSSLGRECAGTVEAASYIPSDIVSRYRNLHVAAIKAGLASKLNIESLTVWVRESLDSPNIMECTVTKDDGLVKGWNTLATQNPVAVSSSGFYLGYTLQQKGGSFAVSAVGHDHAGALFLKNSDTWTDISDSGYGCLSIEAIIEADNLPRYDLAVTAFDSPDFVSKFSDSPWTLSVANNASLTVDGFRIEMQVEGAGPQIVSIDETLLPCEEKEVTFQFAPDLQRRAKGLPFSARLINPLGDDETPDDNLASGIIDFDELDFNRNVLVEEFTTERCVNCPRAASVLNEIAHSDKYSRRVNVACHHAGYGTDFLTSDADKSYVWMYNGGSFCPGILYDRSSTVQSIGEYGSVADNIDRHLALKAGVSFQTKAEYNRATDMVDVTISGGCDWDKSKTPLFATVYLIENAIPQQNQKGASEDFVHNHVVRAYNDIWGVPLEFDSDEKFSYSCSLPMADYYVRDNMEVVAFVHRYDSRDKLACGVENSGRGAIDWNSAAIDNIASDEHRGEITSVEFYDIYGRRLSVPSGLTIKLSHYSDGSVQTEKIICR